MERFHNKYLIDPISKCWNWKASIDSHGYGRIFVDGKNKTAHRFSWLIHNGDIPSDNTSHGVCVLHHCDNRKCVNPDHLFLGSHQDNVTDMMIKNRNKQLCEEKHKLAKLNVSQVRQIKELLNTKLKLREIADKFNVSISTISSIKYGINWKNI